MAKLKRISISLEEDLLTRFDRQAAKQGYPTRSEGIKALMRAAQVYAQSGVDILIEVL